MIDFVWEETPWEKALPDFYDSVPASVFLTLLEGEEEDAVERALEDLQERDLLLDVENLDAGVPGVKMQERLKLEKSLAEGNARLRDFDANDPLRVYLQELDGLSGAAPTVDGDCLSEKQMEQLATAFLPQIVKIAYSYAGKGVLLMDLIQEGSLALWQGLARWQGGVLGEFLNRCTHRAMAAAVTMQARQNGVGARLRRAMEDYRRAERTLLSRLGRNPGAVEVAEFLGLSEEAAAEVANMLRNASEEKRETAEETEPQEPDAENAVEATAYYQLRQRVSELMESLDAVDAQIISLRFGLDTGTPMEDAAIAKKLGISEDEVSRRAANAMLAMRNQ